MAYNADPSDVMQLPPPLIDVANVAARPPRRNPGFTSIPPLRRLTTLPYRHHLSPRCTRMTITHAATTSNVDADDTAPSPRPPSPPPPTRPPFRHRLRPAH
ncbi:hypothetical protein GALMADRAFT_147557 [Galerina marginata CBS 339.88]|uniref:Uncharacterized protein n=1 Tax=Galerina marginata (strain CBS 339.88) TaxID=685588 RepID=A0A067S7R9_GALM3|nr:hypothetical protein GALMADRAFT_147557 [Galerina marginata CBS 339.88]